MPLNSLHERGTLPLSLSFSFSPSRPTPFGSLSSRAPPPRRLSSRCNEKFDWFPFMRVDILLSFGHTFPAIDYSGLFLSFSLSLCAIYSSRYGVLTKVVPYSDSDDNMDRSSAQSANGYNIPYRCKCVYCAIDASSKPSDSIKRMSIAISIIAFTY